MSLKKIYQLRRYIATQAFMQWLVIHFIAICVSGQIWSSFFSSVFEILFCAFLWYMIYLYHNENLKFDVIIDDNDECPIESVYIYYQCVILGGIWLLLVLIYSRYANQPSIAYIVISLFLVAPLFWLKLCFNLVIFVWSHIFSFIFDVSTIHKMYKKDEKGELSVMEGFLQFQFMQAVDECFDADFDLGITDEDLESVGSKFSKRVYTHGHTIEFIDELMEKNSKTGNWAFIIRIAIPVLFLLLSIFSSFSGGVAGTATPVKQKVTAINVNKENAPTAEIIFKDGTGNTQRMAKGDEAVVVRGINITVFRGPEFKFREEMKIPDDYELTKCVVTVLGSRIIGFNGDAILTKGFESERTDSKTKQTKIINVPKGTKIKVGIKDASDNTYYCSFTLNGKNYGTFIKEDWIKPLKNDYWYYTTAVRLPGDQLYKASGWIEGKYLTPIEKRSKQ